MTNDQRSRSPAPSAAVPRLAVRAVIFDLDGVVVSTDEYHYQGWQRLADEEGIPFDRQINHRLRGVSRMESLEIILQRSPRRYTADQKAALAARKNGYYRTLLETLTPTDILPGAMAILGGLKSRGIKVAIGSSSRNTAMILDRIGLAGYFDAVVDGNDISRSKPDPEVFLLAAKRLGVPASECLVVEDAATGIAAAVSGGMKCLAVGAAAGDSRATRSVADLTRISDSEILAI